MPANLECPRSHALETGAQFFVAVAKPPNDFRRNDQTTIIDCIEYL